ARRGGEGLSLDHYRDEKGGELVDLPGAPLPDPDPPAPARFLAHWDNSVLVHARRTGILSEAIRPLIFNIRNPFSMGTVLVDCHVVAGWSFRDGPIEFVWYDEVSPDDAADFESERVALEAFHA